MRAALFVAVLTATAAQVSLPLPFTPVPLTLQPMVVLLGAAALGARLGALTQVLYLTAGIAGLPVFAASPLLPQGAARLLGPTGGYLLSYPLAADAVGWLAERGYDWRYLTAACAMLAGLAILSFSGVAWGWSFPCSTLRIRCARRAPPSKRVCIRSSWLTSSRSSSPPVRCPASGG